MELKCSNPDCGRFWNWDDVQIQRDGDSYDPNTVMFPICPVCFSKCAEVEDCFE